MESKLRDDSSDSDDGYKPAKAKSNSKSVPKSGNDIESDEDRAVADEWEQLRKKKQEGEIKISSNPVAREILNGFRIVSMNMRDSDTGRLMWESTDFGDDMFVAEKEAHIPPSILNCDAVAREIRFSSKEEMENFRLIQRVFYQGFCMEEWYFSFGFVIPGSNNSWQQTIYAAEKSEMLSASLLSGNVTIETSFFDGELFICKTLMRIYYDAPEPVERQKNSKRR